MALKPFRAAWVLLAALVGQACSSGVFIKDNTKFTIPVTGVYITTVIIDPKHINTDAAVCVGGKLWFGSWGENGIITGLDVAMPLRAGNKYAVTFTGKTAATNVSNVLVNYHNTFMTARCESFKHVVNAAIPFNVVLYANQQFGRLARPMTIFTVPKRGIWWVSLRVDCQLGHWAHVELEGPREMHGSYCDTGNAITASAAYYFFGHETFQVIYREGDSDLERGTLLSYSLLERNVFNSFTMGYHHMAYTSYVEERPSNIGWRPKENIDFGFLEPLTNYGHMWSKPLKLVNITQTGTYLVALRGFPGGINQDLQLDFYTFKLGRIAFFLAERGYPTGQTTIINLEAPDLAFFRITSKSQLMRTETLFSIAYVNP